MLCLVFEHFTADGNYSITCGSDKTLKLWNPVKNLFLQKYAGHSNDVLTTCGSGDNRYIFHIFINKKFKLVFTKCLHESLLNYP